MGSVELKPLAGEKLNANLEGQKQQERPGSVWASADHMADQLPE
jgi:hypothetical protein